MLEDYQSTADPAIQSSALDFLRANPTLFNDKLNKDLEGALYKWRELFIQKNKSSYLFLLEMMKHMRGENALLLRKVFSMVIDLDMPEFLNYYSKSSDENCLIMTDLAYPLPDEERYNELNERLQALNVVMASEKFPAHLKPFADKCHLVLKLQVDKMRIAYENDDLQNLPPVLDADGNPIPPQSPAPPVPPAPETPTTDTSSQNQVSPSETQGSTP
jgi:hypothetical protein